MILKLEMDFFLHEFYQSSENQFAGIVISLWKVMEWNKNQNQNNVIDSIVPVLFIF